MLSFGVLASLFALGPVIGFSGVVFALWGSRSSSTRSQRSPRSRGRRW